MQLPPLSLSSHSQLDEGGVKYAAGDPLGATTKQGSDLWFLLCLGH